MDELVPYAAKAVLSSFYTINQFYQFNNGAERALVAIYQSLLNDISGRQQPDIIQLALIHFRRLRQWLMEQQPDAALLYPPDAPTVKNKVVCAEYTPSLQLNVLHINLAHLQNPVLDIGCGKQHQLVDYLIQHGYTAYGIDREAIPHRTIQRISWLDYPFEKRKWGTIISHLGFSNHFRHQHLKQNTGCRWYAIKYMEILHALKRGGSFYYAPDLPFIEAFLDPKQYSVAKHFIDDTTFQGTKITRLP